MTRWRSTSPTIRLLPCALPFIFGTVVTSLPSHWIIAVPLSIGHRHFFDRPSTHYDMRQPLTSIIEMSRRSTQYVWGLWGLFVLLP